MNIWDKFAGPSNGIEEVLWTFDREYPWGHTVGEPTLPQNAQDPGLRDLYCFWIDGYLANIEKAASVFADSAKTWFETSHGGSPTGKQFLDSMLKNNGQATATKMKFPRVAGGNDKSRYDAWGNNGYHAPNLQ